MERPLDLPRLVLASGSPRRRELLALLGIPFRIEAAHVDETVEAGERPVDLAARLAAAKARAVAARCGQTAVLGCDTVVALDGRVLGKPADLADAYAMLTELRGRSHQVYTGVALVMGGAQVLQVVETTVTMRAYSDAEIEAYAASGDPFDKAGGYAIQSGEFRPVAAWEGCYPNVVGMPLCHVARMLEAAAIVPSVDVPAVCLAQTGQGCRNPCVPPVVFIIR